MGNARTMATTGGDPFDVESETVEPVEIEEPAQQQATDAHGNLETKVESTTASTENTDAHMQDLLSKYFKFLPKDQAEPMANTTTSLREQWNIADRLSMIVMNLSDQNGLTDEQIKSQEKNMDRKLKVYDTLKKVGINLYQVDSWWFMRQLTQTRDALQHNLDQFNEELKGVRTKGNHSELYARILESLPDTIKTDKQYRPLVDRLKANSESSPQGGLRDQFRTYKQQARELSEVDDGLEASIVMYNGSIDETSEKIKELATQLAANHMDAELMKQKQALVDLYNGYEKERYALMDAREEISDQLSQARENYRFAELQMNMREVALLRSRKTSERLHHAIKQLEHYRQSKKDVVLVSGHLILVEQAEEYRRKADLISAIGGDVARGQYDRMKEPESTEGYTKQTSQWGTIKNDLLAKRQEENALFKKELAKELYH
ncbi:hypothetical protein HZB02_02335 [Candidatus Woesearchaeota archaeon]|nr:hypothetical protein [Candidatus Woesearchaeota archaeon]